MRFKFFFLFQKYEGNSDNRNHRDVSTLLLLIMLIFFFFFFFFFLQHNAILLHLESLKKNLFFTIWVIFLNISSIYFFFIRTLNIKSDCSIVFLKLILIIFFWWKIYSFPAIFTYKRFNFCDSLHFFLLLLLLFLYDLTQLLQHYLFYWWGLLLLFCFLSN